MSVGLTDLAAAAVDGEVHASEPDRDFDDLLAVDMGGHDIKAPKVSSPTERRSFVLAGPLHCVALRWRASVQR